MHVLQHEESGTVYTGRFWEDLTVAHEVLRTELFLP